MTQSSDPTNQGVVFRRINIRDSILGSIINLLEQYTFSADGGPTDLDPSILGNVFEKTINHITGDAGDQKKELGTYYTPDEITRFCAEETVRPALQERFEEVMIEQWGWTEEMADYDDVSALIEAVPDSNMDVIESLLAEIESFRALDRACGSGHFLTSVQAEIIGIRKALYEGQEASRTTRRKRPVAARIDGPRPAALPRAPTPGGSHPPAAERLRGGRRSLRVARPTAITFPLVSLTDDRNTHHHGFSSVSEGD